MSGSYQKTQQRPTAQMLEMDNRQLGQYGLEVHRDTTAVAWRAYKTVMQTHEVQDGIEMELKRQDEVLDQIDGHIEKVKEEISWGQKLVKYLGLGFCCGFCCSCITDPGHRPASKLVHKREKAAPPAGQHKPAAREHMSEPALVSAAVDTGRLKDVPGLPAHIPEQIDWETAKQDQVLDLIGQKVKQLKERAEVTRVCVIESNRRLDGVNPEVAQAAHDTQQLANATRRVR